MVEHHILTGDAHPIRLPAYRIPHTYQSAVAELDNMLKEGIIESATSPWSSPIVLVTRRTSPCVSVWTTESSMLCLKVMHIPCLVWIP